MNDLRNNIDKLHLIPSGINKTQSNLHFDADIIVQLCKTIITSPKAEICKHGRDWYVQLDQYVITVNANSYAIATAYVI